MTITVVEVIKQADQGLSSPFLCRGDDDLMYFVKGRASGRASQWAEWLAGHLGQALGLPIPDFRLVDVPAAFDPIAARALLARCSNPDFWRRP